METFALPRNEDEERAVLGAILVGSDEHTNQEMRSAIADLSESLFYNRDNVMIYAAIREVVGRGDVPDIVAVKTALSRMGHTTGFSLSACIDDAPLFSSLDQHKRTLHDYAALRDTTEIAHGMLESAMSGSGDPAAIAATVQDRLAKVSARSAANGDDMKPRMLNEIPSHEFEEPAWVWQYYLAPGRVTLLAGAPKAGKSTLSGFLCAAVSKGIPLAGIPTVKVPILWITTEEHASDAARRLQQMGGDPQMIHVLSAEPGKPLRPSWNTMRRLAHWCRTNGIGLIVIDTLARFWDIKDENSASEVNRAFAPILALGRDSGAACLVIHHARKGNGESGDSIRGSSDILSHVDIGLVFNLAGGSNRKITSFSRFPSTPPSLNLCLAGDGYIQVAEWK